MYRRDRSLEFTASNWVNGKVDTPTLKWRWRWQNSLSWGGTGIALVLVTLATLRVSWDFAELRQVEQSLTRVERSLERDNLAAVGASIQQAAQLQTQLTASAAQQALERRLASSWGEIGLKLQSAIPIERASQYIEAQEYARARQLADTVNWLAEHIPDNAYAGDFTQLATDANLRFFEDVDGHIAMRQFRATLDNRNARTLALQIRSDYPGIYAENLELFQSRARQKYNNGLALLASGDLDGARESFAVAVALAPAEIDYQRRLDEVNQRLNSR
ncbi:MAG: hypothetical protein AAFY57_07900 [Cyanobacteria bacterium J06642_2]